MNLVSRRRSVYVRAISKLCKMSPTCLKFFRDVFWNKQRVFVVGGHGGTAFDDNGRAVALHLAHDNGNLVYWIFKSGELAGLDHGNIRPLERGTLKAQIALELCHACLYSHGWTDVTSDRHRSRSWRIDVFLSHGVYGLKRAARYIDCPPNTPFDVTICSSDWERKVRARLFGVAEHKVLPVGLPKHDTYLEAQKNGRDTITHRVVYMPTWRDWLQAKPTQRATDNHIAGLSGLITSMPKKDSSGREFALTLVIHKNIKSSLSSFAAAFSEDRVRVVQSDEVDLQELLVSSETLITDYSSVFWDFSLTGRKAARYIFDKEVYEWITGEYPEASELTAPITFFDPLQIWNFLRDDNNSDLSKRMAQEWAIYSRGDACSQIEMYLLENLETFR
ncbi:CDP-glycerol glycerophosphotransferase family protein [Ruegeria atlantica]|uniref:CDP-glycerol glycerophosphotransferase family protein n=1 Tax=Ruegeria atlantica TaxID=81569 RepID=UPI00147983EB|nr:CDP-glycerol glycerophosphotransferase family protein [Ruegeria atlantica]